MAATGPSDPRHIPILHDPATLLHETVELLGSKLIPALECPARLHAILETARRAGRRVEVLMRRDISNLLATTHDPAYLHHLETAHEEWLAAGAIDDDGVILPECFPSFTPRAPAGPPKDMFARTGFFAFDMSSGISKHTFEAALASASLAVASADRLLAEETTLALCRPPGHHCDTRRAGGYCYLNNAVLAASHILSERPASKVTILDLDFHHGNGTQSFFYQRADVRYISIHGEDEYPYYTGAATETGEGDGAGENFNFPLASGSAAELYLSTLGRALACVRDEDLVVISLGFDTFELDPLGHFKLSTEDYYTIGSRVAGRVGRASILLEGGYVVDRLGANVDSFLCGFESVTT